MHINILVELLSKLLLKVVLYTKTVKNGAITYVMTLQQCDLVFTQSKTILTHNVFVQYFCLEFYVLFTFQTRFLERLSLSKLLDNSNWETIFPFPSQSPVVLQPLVIRTPG